MTYVEAFRAGYEASLAQLKKDKTLQKFYSDNETSAPALKNAYKRCLTTFMPNSAENGPGLYKPARLLLRIAPKFDVREENHKGCPTLTRVRQLAFNLQPSELLKSIQTRKGKVRVGYFEHLPPFGGGDPRIREAVSRMLVSGADTTWTPILEGHSCMSEHEALQRLSPVAASNTSIDLFIGLFSITCRLREEFVTFDLPSFCGWLGCIWREKGDMEDRTINWVDIDNAIISRTDKNNNPLFCAIEHEAGDSYLSLFLTEENIKRLSFPTKKMDKAKLLVYLADQFLTALAGGSGVLICDAAYIKGIVDAIRQRQPGTILRTCSAPKSALEFNISVAMRADAADFIGKVENGLKNTQVFAAAMWERFATDSKGLLNEC